MVLDKRVLYLYIFHSSASLLHIPKNIFTLDLDLASAKQHGITNRKGFVFRSLGYTLERAPKVVFMAFRAITADIDVL